MSKYTISKTSRFLNISNESLRHYERLGLIAPERTESGYRFFNYRDIDKLQGIRRWHNMGLSLSEIERIIYTADYGEVEELLEHACEKAERELVIRQEMLVASRENLQEWKNIPKSLGVCEMTITKDILRVDVRRNDELNDEYITDEAAAWRKMLPAVFISPRFPIEGILARSEEIYWGYGVEVPVFERLGLSHIPSETYQRSCKCVTTVIESVGAAHIACRDMTATMDFCKKNGLKPIGDAWGITLGNCQLEGMSHRYHRVYLPVENE